MHTVSEYIETFLIFWLGAHQVCRYALNNEQPPAIPPEPEVLNFKGPQASIPRNQFLVGNQFRSGTDSLRHRFIMKYSNI
jgi:hypothetical protein